MYFVITWLIMGFLAMGLAIFVALRREPTFAI